MLNDLADSMLYWLGANAMKMQIGVVCMLRHVHA